LEDFVEGKGFGVCSCSRNRCTEGVHVGSEFIFSVATVGKTMGVGGGGVGGAQKKQKISVRHLSFGIKEWGKFSWRSRQLIVDQLESCGDDCRARREKKVRSLSFFGANRLASSRAFENWGRKNF